MNEAQQVDSGRAQTAHDEARRTLVMGILNVTEDSFSDGGRNPDTETALRHAREMIAAGADIIDIGGESTRPGATRVDPAVEEGRVVPVIQQLQHEECQTSIDTMRATTAAAAIEAGVDIINDVSGGLADPDMLRVCAEADVPICLMHWQAESFAGAEGYTDHGGDIVGQVRDHLSRLVDRALEAGVQERRIILDPGIGFAKSPDENWALLGATRQLVDMGFPILIGASRKRFLTALRPAPDGNPGTPDSADDATAAVSALAAAAGAWAVRVHNVAPTCAAVDVAHYTSLGSGPYVAEGWRARRG